MIFIKQKQEYGLLRCRNFFTGCSVRSIPITILNKTPLTKNTLLPDTYMPDDANTTSRTPIIYVNQQTFLFLSSNGVIIIIAISHQINSTPAISIFIIDVIPISFKNETPIKEESAPAIKTMVSR